MVTLAQILYGLLTLTLLPFFGFLALITLAALWPRRRGEGAASGAPRRFVVVIPAHNEASSIEKTVVACRAVDYDPAQFRVVVIADNCTDDTALLARASGAEVVERHDPDRRSKGHAIEYLLEHWKASGELDAFDAVVLVDADTLVDPRLLHAFAAALDDGADFAQGYYSVSNPDASWRTRMLTYALSLFNGVMLQGEDRLGIGSGLRGNGMCFSTRGLARVPWRAYGLVEDQEYSWVLRTHGEHIRFLPDAQVRGEMVSRGKSAVSQRRRWEEGRNQLRSRFFWPILRASKLSLWRRLLGVVDLLFPPQMRLQGGLLLALSVHPLAWVFPELNGVSRTLLAPHGFFLATLGVYALTPLISLKLPPSYLLSLIALPYYAFWKILALRRTGDGSWVRTPREISTRSSS
ncbi:MAG: glycosyltransferase family 2 protein [Isosphaeraceae bacterium]